MGSNRHRLPVLVAASLISLVFPFVANAQNSLPGWTVVRPEKPMTPEDFRKYVEEYSEQEAATAEAVLPEGGDLMTLSMEAGSVLDVEIDELARGLKYDPGLMYKFVHDHIRFYPMWGEVKSAAMTLMDRSGDAFDQASLMLALLSRAATAPGTPHTITDLKYVVGTIRLNASQITNWLNVPNDAAVVGDVLAAAGIPRTMYANVDGTINYVTMNHAWVKATIDTVTHEFDPSFKSHTIKAGLTDSQLEAAMGYTRDTFLTSALQGYSSGSDWVRDLNGTNIANSLTTYTTNLIDYIEANHPAGDLADITGGKTIIPAQESPLPPVSLPYTKVSTLGEYAMDNLHGSYRTKLRIDCGGINQVPFTSQIYGHRLLLTFKPSDPGYVKPFLWLDGECLATQWQRPVGSDFSITLTVYHPAQSSEQRTFHIKAGGMWSIVNGWGHVGTRIIEQHRRILQQNRHDGFAGDSNDVLGESFTLSGLTWAAENCRMQSLVGQISDCTVINYHQLGVMGQYEAPYIDMPMCRTGIASHTGSDEAETAAFLAIIGQMSAYEHGVIHQLQDYGAVSTVKLLDIANDRTDQDKIFSVTAANWASVRDHLDDLGYGYSAAEIADVNSLVTAGYTVYLPEYGDLQEQDWKGIGYLATKFEGGSKAAMYGISGGYNGGYAWSQDATMNSLRLWQEVYNQPWKTSSGNVRSPDPIDLVTGACTYDHTDIAVGNGGFPCGLKLDRQYNSIERLEDGPLGLGWTHGFDITTKLTSDSFQAMGDDSPIDAAANVVGLYVAFDLFRDLSTSALVKTVVASISEKWLMDQMIDNVVVVKQGHEAMQFIKLPDGSFNPSPGKALRLVKEGDNTYLLKDSAGNLLDFDSNNRAVRWSDPHGNVVDFAYTNNKLSSVTSKVGGSVASRSLSFTYDVNHIETVTDSAGRRISFDYDANDNLVSYTDPEDHITTFQYDANDGQLWKVFYPDRPTEPYATNVYDSLGRVMQQTNAAGQIYDYFYSYYRTEELEPEQTPPEGPAARYSKLYYFNDHGLTVAVEDQLGRKTTTQYDGEQRPIRVVSPTGTSVEYDYDLNHNVIETRSTPVEGSGLQTIVQRTTYTTHETAGGRWLNRLTSQTDSAGNTMTYEYDFSNPAYGTEYGDLRKVTLPQVIDYRGQAVTATQQFTYTTYGQPETVTDANGIVTRFEYDLPADGGGLKRTIVDYGTGQEHLNLTTELTYDNVGNVIATTDPQGHVSQSEYFPSRRLRETIAPAPFGYRTMYEYYADGQLHYVRQLPVGNDFTADPNCVALWNLEDGALGTDSRRTNSLTNTGVVASSTHQQGAYAADFELNDAGDNLEITDAALSADFPGRSTDTNKKLSFAFWFRLESGPGPGGTQALFSKTGWYKATYMGQVYNTSGTPQLKFRISSNGGWFQEVAHDSAIQAGRWYHVGITYDDSTRSYRIRIWDDTAGAILGADKVGTFSYNMFVADAPFRLGMPPDGIGELDGLLDEVVVFNDVLTSEEIDWIRQGTYGGSTVVLQDLTYTPTGEPATTRGPYPEDPTPQEYAENFTQYAYDSLDRPWKVTDAENHITETLYWPDGQVWKTIDAEDHAVITNTYDPNGLLYSVEDAKGNETVYDYDDFKRPYRTWYEDDTYEEISYDPNGLVDQTRTRAGQITQFTYDALNRPVTKIVAGNTTTYAYDISSKVVNTTDSVGTLYHSYDRLGRLAAVTDTGGRKVQYAYDELGQRTQLTYPDGNSVSYNYDSLGRLTDINDPGGNLAHYEYDDLSRRVSVSYANGTSVGYTYSHANRLLELANDMATQLSTYGYSYDLVGNRTSMLVNGTESHVYTYDDIYQLVDANYPDAYFRSDTAFTYDPAGNRSQMNNPPTTYLTNSLNQYTFVGSDSFSYDTNGNLTSDGHHGYTYDAQNRLIIAVVAGRTIQYTYDAAGRRIRKDVGGRITQYVYDGDQVIGEYDGSGTRRRTFVYGPGIDEPICLYAYNFVIGDLTNDGSVDTDDLLALASKWLLTEADSGYDGLYDLNQDGEVNNADTDVLAAHWKKTPEPIQVFCYHFDGLGSVVALSDNDGNVVETYAYDAYGRSRPSGIAHANPYRFAGYRWDSETGLYFCRARYYSPIIGRFLQPDPLGYADGINWYLYCANNPIVLVDPLGLCYKPTVGEWAGGVARGVGQGLLNTVQGLQDLAIGTVNLATGWVGALKPYGQGFNGLNTVIPAIPFPQWARNRLVKESDFAYNAEKSVTSTAATAVAGAAIKAASAAWSMAPMAPIVGRAQGSAAHQLATYRQATAWAKSGAYEQVHINRSLRAITGGEVDSLLKPDVTGVLKNGQIDMIEVVSPSQTFDSQMQKIQQMEGLLGPRRAGPGSRAVYP